MCTVFCDVRVLTLLFTRVGSTNVSIILPWPRKQLDSLYILLKDDFSMRRKYPDCIR
jgi:hypothetical protein